MKKIVLLFGVFIALGLSQKVMAQTRLNVALDVLRTPFFNEVSLNGGAELDYFLANRFALTGGFEYWQKEGDQFSGALGLRFYPINPVFIRFRGILNQNSGVNIGMGYALKLSRKLRMETIFDYYTPYDDFAVRIGLGFSL